jgi:hypothetical protein
MLDPTAWYLLFRINRTRERGHFAKMVYNVFLPFLNGGPIDEAVNRFIDTSGWWESTQRSGTCYYRAVTCTIKYLMKSSGFSKLQSKQMWVHIRAAYMDMVLEDFEKNNNITHMQNSDVKMIQIGCSQTVRAALKFTKLYKQASEEENVDFDAIQTGGLVRGSIGRIETLILSIQEKIAFFCPNQVCQNLNMQSSAPLLPFPHFELIMDLGEKETQQFVGSNIKSLPNSFVDLMPSKILVTNMSDYQTVLKLCVSQCKSLSTLSTNKGGGVTYYYLYQTIALIQHTVMNVLPFPLPRNLEEVDDDVVLHSAWFHTTTMTLDEQRDTLDMFPTSWTSLAL